MQDILNNRLNSLCYGLSVPTSTENFLVKWQQLRDNEISQIPKGLVNASRGELFHDEFPSPPGPDFFKLPPVGPADDNFIRPDDLPDVLRTPIIGKFSRPLTNMVDDRKNIIEVTPKNMKQILKKKICLSHWQNFF